MLKENLEAIIKNLVEEKEKVDIKQVNDGNKLVFEVRIAESDMGKVIGKQGRVAKAIRTIMKAIGTKDQKKVMVEFID